MEPLTENDIRTSLVNCSKGEARRIRLPTGFAELDWDDLDFLGWIDPGAPLRAVIVTPGADGSAGPVGIVLRVPATSSTSAVKSSLCSLCLTGHASSGVSLFVAPLAGPRGREGNSVGRYICADLACSLYLRGKRQPAMRTRRYEETLGLEDQIARTLTHLDSFLAKVTAG
ncbi:FBP domain-containing protein [Streptomyces sp. NPDC057638]|uniref:FBP domain-containing protein n=1 Tax=Streptomyces sp. NPDC057638 TaxID=3346190 RepID=UPI0036910895